MSTLIYTLIDMAVTCLDTLLAYYLLSNETKRSGRWRILCFVFIISAVVMIMTKINIPLMFKFTIEIVCISILGNIAYKVSIIKLLLYGVIFIFSVYSSEMIVIQIWNLFNKAVITDNIVYKEFVLSLVLAAKALHFLEIIIFQKIMKNSSINQKFKEILPILIIALPFILVLESINLNLPYVMDKRYVIMFICSSMAVLGSFVFSIIFNNHYFEVLAKAEVEKNVLYALQNKYDYYEKRLKDEERVKEIYHDLKNHLLLVDGTISDEIREELMRFENYYDTGNEFLNIIIHDKYEKAKSKGIKIECDINFKGYDFIDFLDISTIFGNILDNGIEACEKLKEENRFIFLNVAQKGFLLIIVMKNKMLDEKLDINETIRSTKKNKGYHGYGLINIGKAARKYNGEYKIKAENQEFIISIVLPIPEGKRC